MAHRIEIKMAGGDVLADCEWTGSIYQCGSYQTGNEHDVVIFSAQKYLRACGIHVTDDQAWDHIEEYYDVDAAIH